MMIHCRVTNEWPSEAIKMMHRRMYNEKRRASEIKCAFNWRTWKIGYVAALVRKPDMPNLDDAHTVAVQMAAMGDHPRRIGWCKFNPGLLVIDDVRHRVAVFNPHYSDLYETKKGIRRDGMFWKCLMLVTERELTIGEDRDAILLLRGN